MIQTIISYIAITPTVIVIIGGVALWVHDYVMRDKQ